MTRGTGDSPSEEVRVIQKESRHKSRPDTLPDGYIYTTHTTMSIQYIIKVSKSPNKGTLCVNGRLDFLNLLESSHFLTQKDTYLGLICRSVEECQSNVPFTS